jgi:type IV secretion system protein TrbJ
VYSARPGHCGAIRHGVHPGLEPYRVGEFLCGASPTTCSQIQLLADAIKNSKFNSAQTFWNIGADLSALAGIVQGGRAIAYSLGDLDAVWQKTYPGYASYARTGYYTRYQNWAQTTLDTEIGAMRAAGLQGQELNNEVSLITNLESQSESADGRLLALNVLTQMADQQTQQMQMANG